MHWVIAHAWILFLAAWLASWGLTTVQVRHYQQLIRTVRSQSRPGQTFGTGIGKSWLRAGCVVGVITDQGGRILNAYRMTGWSVFARFRPWPDFVGHDIGEWAYPQFRKPVALRRAMAQAADLTLQQLFGTQAPK